MSADKKQSIKIRVNPSNPRKSASCISNLGCGRSSHWSFIGGNLTYGCAILRSNIYILRNYPVFQLRLYLIPARRLFVREIFH